MDSGVLTVVLADEPLDDALEYLAGIGADAVELGCGGFVGDDHLPREEYLDDEDRQRELLHTIEEHDLRISAISSGEHFYQGSHYYALTAYVQPCADCRSRSSRWRSPDGSPQGSHTFASSERPTKSGNRRGGRDGTSACCCRVSR